MCHSTLVSRTQTGERGGGRRTPEHTHAQTPTHAHDGTDFKASCSAWGNELNVTRDSVLADARLDPVLPQLHTRLLTNHDQAARAHEQSQAQVQR